MGHFPFARANFTFAPGLRALLRAGGVGREVFVYWQSRQSPGAIAAIKWLDFPMCSHAVTRHFLRNEKYLSSIRAAATSLISPSGVLRFWCQ